MQNIVRLAAATTLMSRLGIAGNQNWNSPFAGRLTQAKMGLMGVITDPNSGNWQGQNGQQQTDQQNTSNFVSHGFSFCQKC